MTDVSIIIPSHNGADTLPFVFEALGSLSLAEESFEFVLVDNASDDETATLMAQFLNGRSGTALTEQRKGKSFALNLGISKAAGELLLFLDDDVIPDNKWFQAYLEAARLHPECVLFAGTLRPAWAKPPTRWQEHLAALGRSYGCTSAARTDGPYPPELVKGGNFAIRKSALAGLAFDEAKSNFGSASSTGGGEDSALASQIAQDGGILRFVSAASARHIVREHEMTVREVAQRYRRIGRGVAANSGTASMWLALPISLTFFSALAALSWLAGSRNFAALQLTRAASRLGRLDYAIWKLRN